MYTWCTDTGTEHAAATEMSMVQFRSIAQALQMQGADIR